jgi:hypothetical protein
MDKHVRLPDLQEQSPETWATARHYERRFYKEKFGVGKSDKWTCLQDTVRRCVRITLPSVSTGGVFVVHRNCAVKVILIFETGTLEFTIDVGKERRFLILSV